MSLSLIPTPKNIISKSPSNMLSSAISQNMSDKSLEKLWKRSQIPSVFNIFTGRFGEIIQRATPQMLLRSEKFIQFIFWRWYFLEQETFNHLTPYSHLTLLQEKEGWPKGKMILPKPIASIKVGKLSITIDIDFIDFPQQPIISDIKNAIKGHTLKHHYDSQYETIINDVSKENGIEKNDKKIIQSVFSHQLISWYSQDEGIRSVFGVDEWLSFWNQIISEIATNYSLSTDFMLDKFIGKMRKVFKNYAYDSRETIKNSSNLFKDEKRAFEFMDFWTYTCKYILIPLSLYSTILAPVFIDEINFKREVGELLNDTDDEPFAIYSPCTLIEITEFGKIVFT